MRVLIISPTQIGIGGISQHVSGLTNFLRKNNHTVDIISSENTPIIPIKGLKNPSFMLSSYLKTKFTKQYDIVHAHNIPSAMAMKNVNAKKILTLHGIFSEQIDKLHGKIATTISERYERSAIKWADVVTAISRDTFDYYTKLGIKVELIPNAIDTSLLPLDGDRMYDKQVVFAGRLSKEKGIASLLAISEKLPEDVHLIVVGSGPEEDKISALAKQKKNVHYMGYVPHNSAVKLIRGSDVLIQPSLVEAISSTLLEAMACQIPVIVSRVGGNMELVDDGKTGLLEDPTNIDGFCEKIIKILSDKKMASELARNAKKKAVEFDWMSVGEMYMKLYMQLVK